MIIMARSINAQHMKNSLSYVVKNEKDHVFLSADGVDYTSTREMLDDFKMHRKDGVKNEYVTAVISPSPNDKLDIEAMNALLKTVLSELNLTNRQHYSVIHQNTDNPHIHVILNRIDYDGKTWNDHHVAWKCQKACLDVCAKLNLTTAYEHKSAGPSKSKQNEFDQGREGISKEINSFFNEVKFKAKNIKEVHAHLESRGVKIEIKKFPNGLYGCNFTFKDHVFKASKINRLLSLKANGETFAPNPKLEEVLNKNIDRSTGQRTMAHVREEIIEFPEQRTELLAEMHVINSTLNAMLSFHNNDKKREQEEDEPIISKTKRRPNPGQNMRM